MTTHELETVTQVWPQMAPLLFVPQSERDYDHLIEMLDTLIDVVGEAEDHPLASLMDIISVLVEKYEDEHVPELI
jgi:HTH-type transcriptional regulator/antitoxin HigA